MIRSPKSPRLFSVIALAAAALISCVDELELPPVPDDLEERNKALAEVAVQFERLEKADAGVAESLLEHRDYRVRAKAARRLGALGERASAAVPGLLELLDDERREVRIEAADALGYSDDERAIDPLIETMLDPERKVRFWASKAVGRFGTAAAPRLIEHMSGASPLHNLEFEDEAGKKHTIREAIRWRLIAMGTPAVPYLVLALDHEDWRLRSNTITTLGEIGAKAKAAIPGLIKVLQGDDKRLKVYSARSLGKIGDIDPAVVPALKEAEKDRSQKVSKEAKRALREIKKRADKKKREKKKKKKKKKKPKKKPRPKKPAADKPTGEGAATNKSLTKQVHLSPK